MSDALFAVQQAVADALAADAGVQALLGDPARLYDHVPPGAVFPYAAFGALSVAPYDTKTETGFSHVVGIDLWSRYRGGKEARDIFAAIYAVLHRGALDVAGQVFLSCAFHGADFDIENDGLTYRAALRFIVTTQST